MATKDFIFLEGYAYGKGYQNLSKALNMSNKLHGDTLRKDGSLYITHPTAVTATAVRFGIEDENTLCIMQLHDVVEDCDIKPSEITDELNFMIGSGVTILSKNKNINYKDKEIMNDYLRCCLSREDCALAKIGDRAHNISTMFDGFSIEKQKEYIEETKLIIEMCREARRRYPKHSGYITEMKKNIHNICDITTHYLEEIKKIERR